MGIIIMYRRMPLFDLCTINGDMLLGVADLQDTLLVWINELYKYNIDTIEKSRHKN